MSLRPESPRIWRIALGIAAVLSFAAMVPLCALSNQAPNAVIAAVIGVPCAAVGLVVTRRQQGNPIGWLLLSSPSASSSSSPRTAAGWFNAVQGLLTGAVLLLSLAFIARQALSWRRAVGERRQQLKWLASGATVTVVCLVLGGTWGSSGGAITPLVVIGNLAWLGVAALPVSIGVGILKYRLYEIDRIISRTLAYAIVTGLLVGVYAGLVLLATQVLHFHSTVAVAAATLVAAALFSPARRRVQHAVDRRFDRARYDAERMVTAGVVRAVDVLEARKAAIGDGTGPASSPR